MELNILLTCEKSLIQIVNNRGPKMILVEVRYLMKGFLIAFHQFQHTVIDCLNNVQIKL